MPLLEYRPAPQAMQLLELVAPVLVEYRPLLQAVQVLAPVLLLEYRPAPQAIQLLELARTVGQNK